MVLACWVAGLAVTLVVLEVLLLSIDTQHTRHTVRSDEARANENWKKRFRALYHDGDLAGNSWRQRPATKFHRPFDTTAATRRVNVE